MTIHSGQPANRYGCRKATHFPVPDGRNSGWL